MGRSYPPELCMSATPHRASPLVLRPSYGHGHPAMPVGVAKLPEGSPGGKGNSLDSGIPGTHTFDKPVDDIRAPDEGKDESIYQVDGPDDLLKDQTREEVNEDNADKHDGIGYNGEGAYDGTGKTKVPYRDGRPNKHTAYDAAFILGLYQVGFAREATFRYAGQVRTAARMSEMLEGLNPQVTDKARTCRVSVKRIDAENLRWIFAVDSGKGPKVVRLKAQREGNVVRLAKMDLHISCSCPAWQWLGPEYHAKQNDYQDGKLKGTASSPDIKDPEKHNRVCKHVAAVLTFVRTWEVPVRTRK